MNSSRTNGAAPPPPPRSAQTFAREQQQQQQLGLFPSTNYLSPYSASPFYGQQAAGYYNGYRYSPYGAPQMNPPVGNFAQLAMDESQTAFSSIESVITTFRSISIMLESTFTSVYSSFRAVTDVFDHFSRIRTQITAIYPLVLLWRFLKYLYHRLLRLLHLRRAQPGNTEETWSAIYNTLQQTSTDANGTPASSSSSLLVALVFIVSFGTPMLMLKFLNSVIRKKQGRTSVMFSSHLDRYCCSESSSGE
jgi:peroxin-13